VQTSLIIIKSGGADAVLAALRDHPGNGGVQEEGFYTLSKITKHGVGDGSVRSWR